VGYWIDTWPADTLGLDQPWMPAGQHRRVRNSEWFHMFNDDIISMPDK